MTLEQLPVGASCRVMTLTAHDGMCRRLRELGLIDGARVTCLMKSPLGDPAAYRICGAVIALRNNDAATVEIERTDAAWDRQ